GGDPDNFTYPRYALDVSFVRAYEAGGERPARTGDHFFGWDSDGAAEDELIFITGNPGTTSRIITVAQLLYEQEYRHPFLIQLLEGQRALLRDVAAAGPESEQEVRQDLFEVENSLKAYRGQYAGLLDTLLVGRKIRWERELREKVASVPTLEAEYGDVWDRLADVQRRKMALSPRLNIANLQLVGAPHLSYAGRLSNYVTEMAKPLDARAESMRGEAVRRTEAVLLTPTAVDSTIASRLLKLQLEIARRWLAPGDPLLRAVFEDPKETPEQAAVRLTNESRVLDVDFRDRIIRGGADSLAASDDPLLRFARVAAPLYAQLTEQWAKLVAEENIQAERLAAALLAAAGERFPPDATFTLRIADGVVQRYPSNGTVAPPVTSYYGMFGRAADFDNEMPWTLPETFEERRDRIDLATPLNFVSTNDLTGGNSGSPMIDRQARIVGVAFDSNLDLLPGTFVFDTTTGRAISVHARGIIEALRDVYGARALVRELTGR
ncbi:MAG: S46 family peptidase, partial [Longimicrobiales bacterium]